MASIVADGEVVDSAARTRAARPGQRPCLIKKSQIQQYATAAIASSNH